MTEPRLELFMRVNPPALGAPSGFAHGLIAPSGAQILLVAGQTATDSEGRIADTSFAAQFETALARVLAVVTAAGGLPDHIGRMTVFVTDLDAYRQARRSLREIWLRRVGAHYPAMTLVEVSRLFDPEAKVEIEATAVLPGTEA